MSWMKLSFALIIVAASTLLGTAAIAQSPGEIVLQDPQTQYSVGPHMEILEDKEEQWTIEDVTSPEIAAQFVPSLEEAPGFGFTDSAYWVRFRVRNEADSDADWLVLYESAAFFVDYYIPKAAGEDYDTVHTGSALPFDTRDVPVGQFVFQLPVEPQDTKTVHMRFSSEGTLFLPLTLLSEATFAQQALIQRSINGVLYGVLLVVIVYNLALFFTLRDRTYFYYVLFFSTMLLAMMTLDGFAAQYLWPNQGPFAATTVRFFLVLSFTFALLFATSYLRTKELAPRLHKTMVILAILASVVLGLQYVWFRETAVVHVFLMLCSSFSMIFAGILAWRRDYEPARQYLLGWLIVLAGFIVFVLTLVDVLPVTPVTDSIMRAGLVVLAFVWSIGLTERINIYRQGRLAAQLATTAQRTRIAQDLHDSVTQSLYSTNLFAEAGRKTIKFGDVQEVDHYLERIMLTTQQALKEMRLFLYELRPPDVVEDGLVEALQKRLDTVERRAGVEASLLLDGSPNFPDRISDQFYRIGQEALNNVLKHAQADEVTVRLQADDGIMGIKVKDNGCGFNLHEALNEGGQGLRNIRERADEINGELTINTAPNQGTVVTVKVMKPNE